MSTTTATRERRLILKDWEVRAIRDGRKTRTTRLGDFRCNWEHADGSLMGTWGLSVPPYRFDEEFELWRWRGDRKPRKGEWIEHMQTHVDDYATYPVPCPYGQPGDRLWVAEAWCQLDADYRVLDRFRAKGELQDEYRGCPIAFRVDHIDPRGDGPGNPMPWRSPATMPRWASRLTLEITAIRVQRVRDITEEEAIAEGGGPGYMPNCNFSTTCVGHRPMFIRLFRERYGRDVWAENPWAWVIEHREVQP